MVWCIHTAAAALCSSDEDIKKLNITVEALEKVSENIRELIGLLRLEASLNLNRR
jgi:ABC-type transporter Mla MlaB component